MVSKLSPSAISTSPEHEQEERQGSRRFVLRCYSVFNTEQCELPPSVTEELALPEEADGIDS